MVSLQLVCRPCYEEMELFDCVLFLQYIALVAMQSTSFCLLKTKMSIPRCLAFKKSILFSFTSQKIKSVILLLIMRECASINAETEKPYIFIILPKEGWILSINYVKIILCQREGTGDYCVFCINCKTLLESMHTFYLP